MSSGASSEAGSAGDGPSEPSRESVIFCQGLVKRFAGVEAVRGLSLHVNAGEVVGLLGANGAGKTTTLRMLAAVSTPDEGQACIAGHDTLIEPLLAKSKLGFLTGNTALYARLSPREVLRYFGALHGLSDAVAKERTERLIVELAMGAFADRACQKLSSGEKQRANIARTLLHEPPALILDEPTSSLDVVSGGFILDFIRRARQAGKAVLFSTHILAEAELLCDRIYLIHKGALIAQGTVAQLLAEVGAASLTAAFLAHIARVDPDAVSGAVVSGAAGPGAGAAGDGR